MTEVTFPRTLIQRRGTTAQWAASTRVLKAGEFGVLHDPGQVLKFKIGNGVDLWSALPFEGGSGTGGQTDYEHTQSSAAATWTINHNLGRKVTTDVFTTGGVKVMASVLNVSLNQVQVLLDEAMAGYAIIN